AEAERHRRELEDAKKRAERAEAQLADMVKQLRTERDLARAAEQEARDRAERALAAERAARESLEKAGAAKPEPKVQTVAVADESGKYLPIREALQPKIEEQAIAVFFSPGAEVGVQSPGATPLATAERCKRAEQVG